MLRIGMEKMVKSKATNDVSILLAISPSAFFGALTLTFLTTFVFEPTAGRQTTAYSVCTAARANNVLSSVDVGSATRAGNRT